MVTHAMSTPQERLLTLLRSVRLEAGLRQRDLADQLHRPQSYVSKYESGERRLDLFELSAICVAVGISLEEFVRRFEPVQPNTHIGDTEHETK